MKPYAVNKKARYDYLIQEDFEAGVVLFGHEVKAIRTGHVSLKASFVVIRGGEAYLLNSSISPYQPKNTPKDYEPERSRKLLLNKKELTELIGKTKEKGLTLVALKLYNKNGKIKLSIGVGKGKKKADKRQTLRARDMKREVDRALREKG